MFFELIDNTDYIIRKNNKDDKEFLILQQIEEYEYTIEHLSSIIKIEKKIKLDDNLKLEEALKILIECFNYTKGER